MKHNLSLKDKAWLKISEKDHRVIVVGFLTNDLVLVVDEGEPFKNPQLTVHYSLLEPMTVKAPKQDKFINAGPGNAQSSGEDF